MINATEGHRIGLFNRVVPHDQLRAETVALAEQLASKPPIAVALAKRACAISLSSTLDAMLALELEHQVRCFQTRDALEGITAFTEKRRPVFEGA
jgi:enoyl-CoA hydratase/carnithine racemase